VAGRQVADTAGRWQTRQAAGTTGGRHGRQQARQAADTAGSRHGESVAVEFLFLLFIYQFYKQFYKSIYESKSILRSMKTSLLLALILIITAAAIAFSGCVSIPGLTAEPESESLNHMSDIPDRYETDIFIPLFNGEPKVVSSGSYYVLPKSEVRVVRLVSDTNQIQILKETGLLAFGEGEIKDVYFLSAENFSMTPEGVKALETDPVWMDLNYTVKHTNRVSSVILEENFSGLIFYTYTPRSNNGRILVNDGAEAVQIILPANTTTGNRVLGTASPAPDITETAENGEKIMKWNRPVTAVAVKYYNENAPLYVLIGFSFLGGAIAAVLAWNRFQIKRLRKITKFTDPDEEEGFRKQNQY